MEHVLDFHRLIDARYRYLDSHIGAPAGLTPGSMAERSPKAKPSLVPRD